ncbi:MAG: hypothetical protein VR64_02045 [Desulfatitalea sp. BRH_c12]|nr:MAG: hypothetical protein VR64_02045 [Desulfatitalea sp. BRH_c12]
MNLPTATYRIQLHAQFGFRPTADLLDYLQALGISHLYASPVFKARPGSAHGYDLEDSNQFNPELGTEADRHYLVERLAALQMGWLQDIVPNHMAFSGGNPLLCDVLENGPRSLFHDFFDIQWDHPAPELNGAVSAPFLGDDLEACLDRGELAIHLTQQGVHVDYFAQRYPLSLDAYRQVLCGEACDPAGASEPGPDDDLRKAIERLVRSARLYDVSERRKALAAAKADLWALYSTNAHIKAGVDDRLSHYNSHPTQSGIKELLAQQYFRLAHWQTAARQINYRRFFDINELITLRQELPTVFEHTHHLIVKLVREGVFDGLRVDHVDGLFDPRDYLEHLRRSCADTYIVAEKILGTDEALPEEWPVQGTTGYEFAAHSNALFCCPDHETALTDLYAQWTGNQESFAAISRQCKAQVLKNQFAGDLDNMVLKFEAAMQADAAGPALSLPDLTAALAAMLICLPVYRTYMSASEHRASDDAIMRQVFADARAQRPELADALDAIEHWLASERMPLRSRAGKWLGENKRQRALAAFEQLAAPLTAKGIEDTALYRYNRLSALNEVGGDPSQFGATRQQFHAFAAGRQEHWPHTLNALSTHDTKRSADVRARMLVLAELPGDWASQITRWRECNAAHARRTDRGPVPDPEMEYLLYQTLAATFPAQRNELPDYCRRIDQFLKKAAREAKQRTSWTQPDEAYEDGLTAFLEKILDPAESNAFPNLIRPFAARIAHFGTFNALSQSLIYLTAPGIPDIYQGTELFDDSLVDPDNRRPVDFQRRRGYLRDIEKSFHGVPLTLVKALMAQRSDGRIKLFVTWAALQARRRYKDLFAQGRYLPMTVTGQRQRHVVAFARVSGQQWCLTIVPRFPAGLVNEGEDPLGPAVWSDTQVHLPAGAPVHWRNALTDASLQSLERLSLGQVLAQLPVAMLIGDRRP